MDTKVTIDKDTLKKLIEISKVWEKESIKRYYIDNAKLIDILDLSDTCLTRVQISKHISNSYTTRMYIDTRDITESEAILVMTSSALSRTAIDRLAEHVKNDIK